MNLSHANRNYSEYPPVIITAMEHPPFIVYFPSYNLRSWGEIPATVAMFDSLRVVRRVIMTIGRIIVGLIAGIIMMQL